ncbi:MAG: tRNA pseudouridine(55) synthase TruB [Syntrophaceae bacterium]|jgi:tRNA pseudouridine55 synthase|nr:tRNA pseudouridine(55) synthase TruB [Syntrophaceae bacterium]
MDGIVVIDKPVDFTSHDVVSYVKRILGAKKAGHTGTLDPMATGVLPVCLNEATKIAQFLTSEKKTYRAAMLLGVRTDTQDITGKVLEKSHRVIPEEVVRSVLAGMVGKIQQVPPVFSALKYKGKPLYKYARAGECPEVSPREVEIFHLNILNISFPEVVFDISCSKGTYIRTICSDIGQALGCGACLSGLRRLQSGFFTEAMALSLKQGPPEEKKRNLLAGLVPMSEALPEFTAVEIDELLEKKLRDGFQPDVESMPQNVLPFLAEGDMIKFISRRGRLVAIAVMLLQANETAGRNGKARAVRILRVFQGEDDQ